MTDPITAERIFSDLGMELPMLDPDGGRVVSHECYLKPEDFEMLAKRGWNIHEPPVGCRRIVLFELVAYPGPPAVEDCGDCKEEG